MSESTAHAEVEMLDIIKQKINEDRHKWFFQTPELCMLFSHWAAQYETNQLTAEELEAFEGLKERVPTRTF